MMHATEIRKTAKTKCRTRMGFRNRDLRAGDGRWLQNDPLGYHDGMSLYEYVKSTPTAAKDPAGLNSWPLNVVKPPRGAFRIKVVAINTARIDEEQRSKANAAGHMNGYEVEFIPSKKPPCECPNDTFVLNQAIDSSKAGAEGDHWDLVKKPSPPPRYPPGYVQSGGARGSGKDAMFDSPGMDQSEGFIFPVEVCAMCAKNGVVFGCVSFQWDSKTGDFVPASIAAWTPVGNQTYIVPSALPGTLATSAQTNW